jgi:hypothetical protein
LICVFYKHWKGQVLTREKSILIATDYERIVNGYVEIRSDKIVPMNIKFVDEWRENNNEVYYWEYRTEDNVKIYEQIRKVQYADYKLGHYYVFWKDVKLEY